MILKKAEIRNFRSITHLTLAPKRLTTLVGKNSCGKSNILKALNFFFTAAKTGIPEDICHFADDAGTWVECTFGDLSESEKTDLAMYLRHDGTVRVRRTLYRDGDRCVTELHGYVQHATEAWLQDDYPDYADMGKWATLGIDVKEYAKLGAKGGLTKAGFKEFQQAYISKHANTLAFSEVLSETQFKGRQSTASTVLPHFIYVPAVGDIVPQIYGRQSSLLNEMVAEVIETAKTNPDYVAAQASLSAAQEFVNPSARRLGKLTLIEEDLEKRLESWPGTKVSIRTEVEDLAQLLVSGLVLGVDDGNHTDLADKGDGIQRQVLFRVFQLYADFKAQRGVFKPEQGEPPVDRRASIVAFEEPELFLHPQAQERFFDDLLTVSNTDQVLLSTHSSFLVQLEHADGLHIVRRPSSTAPTGYTTADQNWINADERQRLREIKLFSGEASKVFFADRVVITEGQEDVIYIAGTARDHAKCLDRRVTVVEAGGKEAIPSLQKVLNAFAIPYVVACDLDPGNAASAETYQRIQALVEEAKKAHGPIASTDPFDPNIPTVCCGTPVQGKVKPSKAMEFVRTSTPTAAFSARVKALYTI